MGMNVEIAKTPFMRSQLRRSSDETYFSSNARKRFIRTRHFLQTSAVSRGGFAVQRSDTNRRPHKVLAAFVTR